MPEELKYQCPARGCEGRSSTINLLARHLAILEDLRHKNWRLENGIIKVSPLNSEIIPEIRRILEERQNWNPETKLYEFY